MRHKFTPLSAVNLLSSLAVAICDRARGALPKARFWLGALSSRARSAVSRDDSRRYIRLNKALSLTFKCGFLATQKLTLRIKPRAFASQTVRGFSYSLFLVFPSRLPFPRGTLIHHSRPRKGRLAKSAVLARCVIESRGKRGSARHFLFRTTFGVRLRSRLGRLVCALLRFRERPRTIEVQRTTSSPQNHRKSLAQYSVLLFI